MKKTNKLIIHKKHGFVGKLTLLSKFTSFFILGLIAINTHATISDVQINSLIIQAIQSHPSVGAAIAEQEATEQGITAAKLNLLPTPSIASGYDKENDLISKITLRQPLWTGGRLTANVNQAIFDDKAAVEGVFVKQNEVAKTTVDAWQSYVSAIALQRIYKENLDQLSEFEAMMQRRVSQGISARIELDLLNNRILQEQNSFQAAQQQEQIALARLQQITGQQISQSSSLNIPKLENMVQQAKQQSVNFGQLAFNDISFYNPSVVRAAYQIEAAKQGVKADKAALYPQLYAQYEHAYYHQKHEDDSSFSLGLNYEPGAGLSNIPLSNASQARVNSLIQQQEAERRAVIEEIQTSYQKFVSTRDQERSLVAAVAGSQIVISSYKRQFIAGRKSWLDVLNSLKEYGGYKVQLVEIRTSMLASFYKLQIDFGLMPWQRFQYNREPVELFTPLQPIKNALVPKNNSITFDSE